jgi:hypothetical protein
MSWVDEELGAADFGDERLNARGRKVVERLAEQPMFSIPSACHGWAEIQAAYRFFDNEKVTTAKVLAPHVAATIERMREQPLVLCIQDTSELDYTGHPQTSGLGPLNYRNRRGLYVHPTLAVTPQRLCLGVIDHHLWVRDAATHGDKTRRRKKAIADKESQRWVDGYSGVCKVAQQIPNTTLMYVADREADIYEVFLEAAEAGNRVEVLIRSRNDRALEGGGKLRERVASAAVLGTVEFDLPPAENRVGRHVVQELQALRCTLRAPYRPKGEKKLPNLAVTAVLAREHNPPPGAEPLQWLLLTTRPVSTFEQAATMMELYLCRWQIEVYFRILKSGCTIEKLQLEDVERLKPALAVYMIIAWRVLFMTMLGRQYPNLPCDVVFETAEWQAVYVVTKRKPPPPQPPSLNVMIAMVAEWGGFTNRKTDGPPGPKTIWIGLQRAKDFARGVEAQTHLAVVGCV